MEDTTEVTTAPAVNEAEPTFVMPTQADLDAALAYEAALAMGSHVNTDFPSRDEIVPPVAPEDVLIPDASLPMAPAVAEETFVPLPGHEIQHTAHLTDGPPWN